VRTWPSSLTSVSAPVPTPGGVGRAPAGGMRVSEADPRRLGVRAARIAVTGTSRPLASALIVAGRGGLARLCVIARVQDGGVGQSAAAGDLAVGPAPLAHPLLDQLLQRVERVLWRRGGARPLCGGLSLVVRRMRWHSCEPNPPFLRGARS